MPVPAFLAKFTHSGGKENAL
jgi:hypothetical protein